MKTTNILLVVDGTAESYAAAQIAWQLAETGTARVKAIQITDTARIWKSMAPGEVGLIGSGPYLAAYEIICGEIRKVASAVEVAYDSRLKDNQNVLPCVTKEGEVGEILATEAADSDIIIAGSSIIPLAQIWSLVQKPVLLVRNKASLWSRTRVLLSHKFPSSSVISEILTFTRNFDARMEFYCYASPQHREDCVEKTKQLSSAVNGDMQPLEIPLLFHDMNDTGAAWRAEMVVQDETLVIVPVVNAANYAQTSLGTEVGKFAEHCSLPCVLLWPCDEMIAPLPITVFLADRLRARG